MKKLIHIDLVPNFEEDDFEIIKNLKNCSEEKILEAKEEALSILKNYFPNSTFYFFNSARSALRFVLEIIKKFDERNEIINQAFTCLVVPNAIKFASLKPVYIDIDESFELDLEDLKRKINENTLAIISQNTFGIPTKIEEVLNLAKEKNIFVIENLTHSLGAKYQNVYLGNFGDFALLSFNRNKVISSIIGGALVVNNKNFLEIIEENYKKLKEKNNIEKIIFTGYWFYQLKKNYNFLNKKISILLRKLGLTLEMISSIEKQGKEPENYLFKFPEKLFPLLLNQLKKLEKLNNHRKEIAQIYSQKFPLNFPRGAEPIFLRYPILTEDRNEIWKKFKKENIYLGDWYFCPLYPCVNFKNFAYQVGSCPKAEEISRKILNLPTYIDLTVEDAEKILNNF